MKKFKLGFVQNSPKILKVPANRKDCLAQMAKSRADLWVLPEFFATGYHFKTRAEVRAVAEAVPGGPTCRALLEFTERRGCAVVAGLVEKSGKDFYNSAVLVWNGKARVYRETHLFGTEKEFFKPGDTGFWVQEVAGVKIRLMICFDWFFPEAARVLALKGAQVLAHPSNLVLPWGPEAMKIRSLENRVFSVTANRVGAERGLRFIGQSQIVSPGGAVLARAGKDSPETAVFEIDADQGLNKKITWQNDLFADRRPEFYGPKA